MYCNKESSVYFYFTKFRFCFFPLQSVSQSVFTLHTIFLQYTQSAHNSQLSITHTHERQAKNNVESFQKFNVRCDDNFFFFYILLISLLHIWIQLFYSLHKRTAFRILVCAFKYAHVVVRMFLFFISFYSFCIAIQWNLSICVTIYSLTRTLKDYTINRQNSNAIVVVCMTNVKKLFTNGMNVPSSEK